MKQTNVKPAEGRLGIMVVGCGAVATTFMTGVLMTRKGLTKPIGSMTQYDKIRVGRGSDKKIPALQRHCAPWLTSRTLSLVHGMYIHRTPIRLLFMPKC